MRFIQLCFYVEELDKYVLMPVMLSYQTRRTKNNVMNIHIDDIKNFCKNHNQSVIF